MLKRIFIGSLILLVLSGIAFVARVILDRERISSVVVNEEVGREEDIAVLFLGQVAPGEGGQWHFAPGLVDTIVLVYYRFETNTVNFISLPRDLYGQFGDRDLKLNRINNEGKIEELLGKMEEITGVPANKYVVLSLETVAEAVDGLGGIDVDLPTKVTDPVSGYTLDKGAHRLQGEDAVWLIRNRYAPEGDFFREKNQHLVAQAVFKKFESLSSIRKTAFAFRIWPQIMESKVNFSTGDLIGKTRNIKDVDFNSVVLDFDTGLLQSTRIAAEGDAYVLIPTEGINEYEQIREYIQGQIH